MRVADRGEELVLGIGIPIEQPHDRRRLDRCAAEQPIDDIGGVRARGDEVVAPRAAPLRDVDAAQEARDHLAQLRQHQPGVLASLRQRVRPHPQQQRFEPLAAAVDADVRQRRRREHAAHGIERLRPGGLAVDEVGVGRLLRHRGADVLGDELDEQAVRVEHAVHVADVAGAVARREHPRVTEVPVTPTEAGVVGDVAGALLEVAEQPSPFEDLGQQVRGLLARQVDATELGDGVVPVLDEHLLVEVFRPRQTDGGVETLVADDVELADELVEEQSPQALRAPAVTGEEGALHDLGQVDEREDRPVEIGEVPPEDVGFLGRELLGDVHGHEGRA